MAGDRPKTMDGEPLRDEFYPPLPDIENDIVSPAPDGRPWLKGCGECLFRTTDPQGVGSSYADSIRLSNLNAVGFFYCVHRKDGEHERVCASYAACRAGAHNRSKKYAFALAQGRDQGEVHG